MKRDTSSKTYGQQVAAIAEQLAPRFQAGEFDNTLEGDGSPLFLKLEEFCERLPICLNAETAKTVLIDSPYADDAAWYYVESCSMHPTRGKTWTTMAAWCLSRDVQDEAIRRGWARSVERRARVEMTEPTLYERRGLEPGGRSPSTMSPEPRRGDAKVIPLFPQPEARS